MHVAYIIVSFNLQIFTCSFELRDPCEQLFLVRDTPSLQQSVGKRLGGTSVFLKPGVG